MNAQRDVKMLWNYSTKMKYVMRLGIKQVRLTFLKSKIFFSHIMYPIYSFPSFYSPQSLPTSPPTLQIYSFLSLIREE